MSKFFFILGFALFSKSGFCQKSINLYFENIANGKKIVLNDEYSNCFGEKYTVTKLKYYISNVSLATKSKSKMDKTVYLIDASKNDSIGMKENRKAIGVSFLLGVDSILNCSGAQSGALDPLNDMFWTWNNGYVMFKFEGQSDSSKADNNRLEYHIGGYKGSNKVMQKIFLPFDETYLLKNNAIKIVVDLDEFWKATNEIRIAQHPVITVPGPLAKKVSVNFAKMFSLKN
jgi:hypothetical protein